MTPRARSGPAPGSPRSPACWTSPAGRRGCGSSSARNAPTPARSCGSPTSTATGSPAFATSTKGGQLADLELRHRRRARCEDRIRCAKDTGLRNLPLHGFAQNQLWCEIVALACELLAWTQMLALTGTARRWEPKRLRLRIFTCAGRIVRGGRRLKLRLAASWPWATGDHHRDHPPPGPRTRLTSQNHPCDQEGHPAGPWNPAHPARQPGRHADRPLKKAPSRSLKPPNQDHERCRLAMAQAETIPSDIETLLRSLADELLAFSGHHGGPRLASPVRSRFFSTWKSGACDSSPCAAKDLVLCRY